MKNSPLVSRIRARAKWDHSLRGRGEDPKCARRIILRFAADYIPPASVCTVLSVIVGCVNQLLPLEVVAK